MAGNVEANNEIIYDSSGSQDNLSWISWFCSIAGREYFSEISEDYIEDEFNLCGLASNFKNYDRAMDMILDNEPPDDDFADNDQVIKEEEEAEQLYSMIHQRYILTRHGLQQMYGKYQRSDFGLCPRDLCFGAHTLPVGTSDVLGMGTVKLYCPSCMDIYNPPSSRFNSIDGAGFGTTFAHLFMLTYPEILSCNRTNEEVPFIHEERIFGFRVSPLAISGAKMKWLRRFVRPEDFKEGELEFAEFDKQQMLEDAMDDEEEDDDDGDIFQEVASAMEDEAQDFSGLADPDQPAMNMSPLRSMAMGNSDSTMSVNPVAGDSNVNGN
ncbi:casein kinase 2 regulatory subunit [Entomophthora muscae]|uniref:Casein kinase 2 regulatory subunit n=1 Tax=Entomophthora muscae TaxID=34485 RepID=A0ACC2TJH0_9FUNG|nr:casein kinase 2 regulatory subunit [Entomophthora muscae]